MAITIFTQTDKDNPVIAFKSFTCNPQNSVHCHIASGTFRRCILTHPKVRGLTFSPSISNGRLALYDGWCAQHKKRLPQKSGSSRPALGGGTSYSPPTAV